MCIVGKGLTIVSSVLQAEFKNSFGEVSAARQVCGRITVARQFDLGCYRIYSKGPNVRIKMFIPLPFDTNYHKHPAKKRNLLIVFGTK